MWLKRRIAELLQDQGEIVPHEFLYHLQECLEHYELEDASDFARAIHISATCAGSDQPKHMRDNLERIAAKLAA